MIVEKYTLREIIYLYFSISAILIAIGALSLDTWLTLTGILPLCAVAIGYLLPEPELNIDVKAPGDLTVGDQVELKVKVISASGIGAYIAIMTLPPCFKYNNRRKVLLYGIKTLSPHVAEEILRVQVCKSGKFDKIHLKIYSINALLVRITVSSIEVPVNIHVRPRVYRRGTSHMKIRVSRVGVAGEARALFGPISLDFKEIRRYVPGDPPRLINWKVTARLGSDWPYVNEMEREATGRVLLVPLFDLDLELEDEPVGEAALSLLLSLGLLLCREGYLVYIPTETGRCRRLRRTDSLTEIADILKRVSKLAETEPQRLANILEKCVMSSRSRVIIAVSYVRDSMHVNLINQTIKAVKRIYSKAKIVLIDVSHCPEVEAEEVKLMYIIAKRRLLRALRHRDLLKIEASDLTLSRVPAYMSTLKSMVRACR